MLFPCEGRVVWTQLKNFDMTIFTILLVLLIETNERAEKHFFHMEQIAEHICLCLHYIYLWDTNGEPHSLKLLAQVMYARTDEELSAAIDAVDCLDEQDKFVKRLHGNLERQQEWVAQHRSNLITRSHDTNNFAEASIRIMKDILLHRTKAFNIVALVEFCGLIWTQYMETRLLSFAHNRRSRPVIMYEKLCSRMKELKPELAKRMSETTWEVPSATTKGTKYQVNVELGTCACPSGHQGGFCKHQAWLHKHFKTPFPNVPVVSETERYALAQLALGKKCPPPSFFQVHLCSSVVYCYAYVLIS